MLKLNSNIIEKKQVNKNIIEPVLKTDSSKDYKLKSICDNVVYA